MFGLQHGNVIVTNRAGLCPGPGLSSTGLTLASLSPGFMKLDEVGYREIA